MKQRIRTLIVDDEALAREGLKLLLDRDDDIEVIGECDNGTSAIERIRRDTPDLVFLDIQMPGISGLGVLSAIPRDRLPMVVFVTAHDEFAVAAFEMHALDYLLKPVEFGRLDDTLKRVKKETREQSAMAIAERVSDLIETGIVHKKEHSDDVRYLTRIAIRDTERIYFVTTEQIDWIEAADNYIRIHSGTDEHLMRSSLSAIEFQLDPMRFVRIHRSTIVNVDRIKELRPHFQGEYHVHLDDGTRLKLSRGYKDRIAHLLGDNTA